MAVLKTEGRTFPTATEVLVIGAGACGTIAALAAKEGGSSNPAGYGPPRAGAEPAGGCQELWAPHATC